ncbi:hypothetical protein R6Q57_016074, partial [Mikania cordata]
MVLIVESSLCRHMETYMGGGVKGWNIGLLAESVDKKKQLKRLRVKYAHKILRSVINTLHEDILVQAKQHDRLPTDKKKWPTNLK